MITDLKPYAEYKESGSKWLGDVPVTWEVRNLRTLISKRVERNQPELPLLSVAREKGVFVRSLTDADENHNVIPDDLSNYKVARAGNLVINKMKAWQGSMGIAPCDGIVSPAYFVFDFRIANEAYGEKLLRSKPYVAHFGQASDGVRVGQWDLSISGMRQIPVLLPPPDEQAAIVRFLDWATHRLDRAIRAKRKVIALLNEQKQAIIHRAVTRGLDPSVPLKASGVAWLGEVPQHWEVRRIGHLGRVGNGSTPARSNPRYWQGGVYPWLSSANVRRVEIDSAPEHVTEVALRECHLPRVPPGSVVVAITGQGRTRGMCALLRTHATVSQHLAYFVAKAQSVVSEWVHLALTGAYVDLRALSDSSGGTKSALTCQDLKVFCIPVPPVHEQRQVLRWVEVEAGRLGSAAALRARELERMSEYRVRLVADVVTGKLDVRAVAATLPDEAVLDPARSDTDLCEDPDTVDDEADA